jgi:hypothetical protein
MPSRLQTPGGDSPRTSSARTDLVFIPLALAAVIEATRRANPVLYRRYVAMILDGLRPTREGPSNLPVAALTGEQTHAVITRATRDSKLA